MSNNYELPNKPDFTPFYHLSCDKCGYDWIMNDGFPVFCPNCGIKRKTEVINNEVVIDDKEIKDCNNCKYGRYNDIFDTNFCYYKPWYSKDKISGCKNWDKWEAKEE